MYLRPSARVDIAPRNETLKVVLVNKTSTPMAMSDPHFLHITVYPRKCSKSRAKLVRHECR
jgi:hypothetical protein